MKYGELLRQRQVALENRALVRAHIDDDFYVAQADLDVLESVEEDFNRLNIMVDAAWHDMMECNG